MAPLLSVNVTKFNGALPVFFNFYFNYFCEIGMDFNYFVYPRKFLMVSKARDKLTPESDGIRLRIKLILICRILAA